MSKILGERLGSEGVGAWRRKAYGSWGAFWADSSTEGRGFASRGGCFLLKSGVRRDPLRLRLFTGTTTLGDLGRWRPHPLGPVGGALVDFNWDGGASLEFSLLGLIHC